MSRRATIVLIVIALLAALVAGYIVVSNLHDTWDNGTGGGAGFTASCAVCARRV